MPLLPKNIYLLIIISFISAAFICTLSSCKKDKNSPVLLFVKPDNTYFDAYNSDILKFDISGSAETELKNFSVTGKPGNAATITVFDTSFSSKKFNISYEYRVPDFAQDTTVLLTFILTDEEGNHSKAAKIIRVISSIKYPVETTGNEMYSSISSKQDAYNLNTTTPLFSSTSPAASQHIKDATQQDSTFNYLMSKKWVSPAGLLFIRFNDFDYANASFKDIKSAYDAGNKKDFIDKIANGDIILTRLPNTDPEKGYIAIKIIYVIEQGGAEFDRYVFNIKK